jgi:hypothetical protein
VLIYGVWIFPKLDLGSRSRNGFVQNNDGFYALFDEKKCRLEKYFKILVLKKSESQFEKNINLGFLSDANVV